jgi:hypothetical protein
MGARMASHTSRGQNPTRQRCTLFPQFECPRTFTRSSTERGDSGMARRLIFGCGLLLCGVIASCTDSTAPTATLLIEVSPDTVHIGQGVVPQFITYSERLVSVVQAKVWITIPQLETEVTPGKWQALVDPNNVYLQPALGDASPVTSSDLSGVRSLYVPLVPGRYRVRQQYKVSAPNATDATGSFFMATSNPFIVVTP